MHLFSSHRCAGHPPRRRPLGGPTQAGEQQRTAQQRQEQPPADAASREIRETMVKAPLQRLIVACYNAFYCNPQRGPVVNHKLIKLDPGLYLVATPLGSARDITLRALDILASAKRLVLAAVRSSLLIQRESHPISTGFPWWRLHASPPESGYGLSNAGARFDVYCNHIDEGRSVADISEAGTPLICRSGLSIRPTCATSCD